MKRIIVIVLLFLTTTNYQSFATMADTTSLINTQEETTINDWKYVESSAGYDEYGRHIHSIVVQRNYYNGEWHYRVVLSGIAMDWIYAENGYYKCGDYVFHHRFKFNNSYLYFDVE